MKSFFTKTRFLFVNAILLAASATVINAETISLSTGTAAKTNEVTPMTSKDKNDTLDVLVGAGDVTDKNKDGYADARFQDSYGDPGLGRDAKWTVTYADLYNVYGTGGEYGNYYDKNGNLKESSKLQNQAIVQNMVAFELAKQGSTAYNYIDDWVDHGLTAYLAEIKTAGVSSLDITARNVYTSTADLYAEGSVAVQKAGVGNLSAGEGAGVITTFGGGYMDEIGQYIVNDDLSVTYLPKDGKTGTTDLKTNGMVAVQGGMVAFTTGFNNDPTSEFSYINGDLTIFGELVGIYVNGKLIDDSAYVLNGSKVGGDAYEYAYSYQFEIDYSQIDGLADGNNNISFMIVGYPNDMAGVETRNGYGYGVYGPEVSLMAFSGNLNQNTESIFTSDEPDPTNPTDPTGPGTDPAATPEPATMLILGLGSLVGFGFIRKNNFKDIV